MLNNIYSSYSSHLHLSAGKLPSASASSFQLPQHLPRLNHSSPKHTASTLFPSGSNTKAAVSHSQPYPFYKLPPSLSQITPKKIIRKRQQTYHNTPSYNSSHPAPHSPSPQPQPPSDKTHQSPSSSSHRTRYAPDSVSALQHSA